MTFFFSMSRNSIRKHVNGNKCEQSCNNSGCHKHFSVHTKVVPPLTESNCYQTERERKEVTLCYVNFSHKSCQKVDNCLNETNVSQELGLFVVIPCKEKSARDDQ